MEISRRRVRRRAAILSRKKIGALVERVTNALERGTIFR
jgi:hypothetical protein